MSRRLLPPFTDETAAQKARMSEDAWNSRDPGKVSLAYTEDSRWRNRDEFITGSEQIVAFLTRKWARELDYRLIKEVWAHADDRIAVRFAYEWRDGEDRWYRSYGNENWQFDQAGLMAPDRVDQRSADRGGGTPIPLAARRPSCRQSFAERPEALIATRTRAGSAASPSHRCAPRDERMSSSEKSPRLAERLDLGRDGPEKVPQSCAVGPMTTLPTSTSSGCSIAKAMPRATASGGIGHRAGEVGRNHARKSR